MAVDLLMWPEQDENPTRLGPFEEVVLYHGNLVAASLAENPEVVLHCLRLYEFEDRPPQWRLATSFELAVTNRRLFKSGFWHREYARWSVVSANLADQKTKTTKPIKRRTVIVQEKKSCRKNT